MAGSGSAAGGASGGGAAAAPDNSFRIAGVQLDRRHGTAKLAVAIPGPGLVAVDGAVPQQRQAKGTGRVVLRVLPKRRARNLLQRQGSVRLELTVTFIPSGGSPNSRDLSLRLKKTSAG